MERAQPASPTTPWRSSTKLRGPALPSGDPGYACEVAGDAQPDPGPRRALSQDRGRVDAVNFAREQGLVLAVRGGGPRSPGCRLKSTAACCSTSAPRCPASGRPRPRPGASPGRALWGDVDREDQAFRARHPRRGGLRHGRRRPDISGGYGWLRRSTGSRATTSWRRRSSAPTARSDCLRDPERGSLPGPCPEAAGTLRRRPPRSPSSCTRSARWSRSRRPCTRFEDLGEVLRGWRDYVEGAPERGDLRVRDADVPGQPGCRR